MNDITLLSTPTIFDGMDISESTKAEYLSRLPKFLGWLRNNGINYDTLLQYKQYLRSRDDLSVSSKNKYLAVARISLKELHRRGKLPVDITSNVKSLQQSHKHRIEGLNEQEVIRLCEHLQNAPESFKMARLKVIVALLLFQGLRQIEITRLDLADVDLPAKRIHVHSKGRDDKESIHLHPETTNALRRYLKLYRKAQGPLLTSLTKQAENHTPRLTTRGLRKIVQQAMHRVGIEKTVHGCRHYFATKLITSYKGDLLRVASYTRHRSIEMLQVYNDSIADEADLPRYYSVFEAVKLS